MSDVVVICRECGKPEYWGEVRWINNISLCRSCYKAQYKSIYNKEYTMSNLDGRKPSLQDYLNQKD